MTTVVKTQKKQTAVRGQGSLNVPGKKSWKETLRKQGLEKLAKKKKEEEKMDKLATKKQAIANAEKEKKLDGELDKAMNKRKVEDKRRS